MGEPCPDAAFRRASRARLPRQDAGRPVPTPLMNVLLRAIARLKDNASAAARAFEAFHLYGAAHDVDSYNCVIESCAAAGKVRRRAATRTAPPVRRRSPGSARGSPEGLRGAAGAPVAPATGRARPRPLPRSPRAPPPPPKGRAD
jgi:hypothetical protein